MGSMVSVMAITIVLMLFLSILPYALNEDHIEHGEMMISASVRDGVLHSDGLDDEDVLGFTLKVNVIGTDLEYSMSDGIRSENVSHHGGTLLLNMDDGRRMNAEYELTVYR